MTELGYRPEQKRRQISSRRPHLLDALAVLRDVPGCLNRRVRAEAQDHADRVALPVDLSHVVPGLRIGARVRCIAEDDSFVPYGLTGLVTNTAPPRPNSPVRARVAWQNDTSCMIDADRIEVIQVEQQEAP